MRQSSWPAACVAVALFLAGCAVAPPAPADRVGRIYTYVRSNVDGSEPETVHVFRARRDFIEVAKMRERCTNAAFVTAHLDLAAGEATRLTGGRLLPGARHADFATLEWDAPARRIDARAKLGDREVRQSVAVPDRPWHLYDFDFASLTITQQSRTDRRADFSFGVPLVWLGENPDDFLRYLGRADARFAGTAVQDGRELLRFAVSGPAFGARGGEFHFDAAEGHLVRAQLGVPNHDEYDDFLLRLVRVDDGGAAAWERVLSAHFDGCPASGR